MTTSYSTQSIGTILRFECKKAAITANDNELYWKLDRREPITATEVLKLKKNLVTEFSVDIHERFDKSFNIHQVFSGLGT